MKKRLLLAAILLIETTLTLTVALKELKENQDIRKKAAETAVKIYFDPSYLEVKEGENFEATLWLDPNNFPVVGADIKLKFDPDYLEVAEWLGGSNSFFYPDTGRQINNQSGEVVWTALSFNGVDNLLPPLKTITQIGKIKIVAQQKGQTIIEPVFSRGKTTDSNVAGENNTEDLLSLISPLSINIVSTTTSSPTPTPSFSPTPTSAPIFHPTSTPAFNSDSPRTTRNIPTRTPLTIKRRPETINLRTMAPVNYNRLQPIWLKKAITFLTGWFCRILPVKICR